MFVGLELGIQLYVTFCTMQPNPFVSVELQHQNIAEGYTLTACALTLMHTCIQPLREDIKLTADWSINTRL